MMNSNLPGLGVFNMRTVHHHKPREIGEAMMRALYHWTSLGPTSANGQPSRFVFAQSNEAKTMIADLMDDGNKGKVRDAPLVVVIGYDMMWPAYLARTNTHPDAAEWFRPLNMSQFTDVALQSSAMQAAYFIMAARMHGFDVGPMGGFSAVLLADKLWPAQAVHPHLVLTIGGPSTVPLRERGFRLPFDEVCKVM